MRVCTESVVGSVLDDPVVLPEESQHAHIVGGLEKTGDEESKAQHVLFGKHAGENGTHRSSQRLDHVDDAHDLGSLLGRHHVRQEGLSRYHVHDGCGRSEQQQSHCNGHVWSQWNEGHGHG